MFIGREKELKYLYTSDEPIDVIFDGDYNMIWIM